MTKNWKLSVVIAMTLLSVSVMIVQPSRQPMTTTMIMIMNNSMLKHAR